MLRSRSALAWALLVLFTACSGPSTAKADAGPTPPPPAGFEVATFAGGCFWCMEPPFESVDGVQSVVSGYTGGSKLNPTYEEVSAGGTGHAEAVEITFDPKKVSYRQLLDIYWHNIDPTTRNRQFADVGTQYRTAIFVHSEEQRKAAEASKKEMDASGVFGAPIVTEIVDAGPFYAAEDYHQDFYKKNPVRYKSYRIGSGRQGYLERLWGDQGH